MLLVCGLYVVPLKWENKGEVIGLDGRRFGLNLKHLREERGMSQADLAEKIGVSNVTVSGFERGRVRPSFDTLTRLADALGVPISDLFRDDPTGLQDALGVYLRARGPWTPDQEERLRQDIELVIRLQKERARADAEAREQVGQERKRRSEE